jgi:Fe-S cluster assembly protein SufD
MMSTIEKLSITDNILKLAESHPSPLRGETERDLALSSFKQQDIPGRKSEEYKYCKVDLILKDEFELSGAEVEEQSIADTFKFIADSPTVVVVNGVFNERLSSLNNLSKGLIICSVQEAFKSHKQIIESHFLKYAQVDADPFIALNAATAKDGVFIHVNAKAVIETPIQVVYINSSTKNILTNSHNIFIIEKSAQAKIIEHFVSSENSAKSFNNSLTEIVVAENAVAEHYKIQDEKENGNLVSTTQIEQNKQTVFTTNTITLSGAFVRNNLNIVLNGEHIESNLNGLYLTQNNQVVDNHTLVDHQQPNCNSNELYKGIINDESTATFNGKIFVRKDAQKTNAFQSNKNILLSDDGTVNTKPQLEIYADDVKCSHGTSTGKLDEEKIFYLRARGLSEESAKKLLMIAFASDVLNKVSIEPLKEILEERIGTMLK